MMDSLIDQRRETDDLWSEPVPLAVALKTDIPEKKCTVYKISIPSAGAYSYIGFTSQIPEERLRQHIQSAEEGSQQNVHVKLREFGMIHEFEVISEHPNEILALVAEVAAIKAHSADLNVSEGGEGASYNLIRKNNEFGESIFFVENKSYANREKFIVAKIAPGNISALENKIQSRYRREINRYLDQPIFEGIFINYFGYVIHF